VGKSQPFLEPNDLDHLLRLLPRERDSSSGVSRAPTFIYEDSTSDPANERLPDRPPSPKASRRRPTPVPEPDASLPADSNPKANPPLTNPSEISPPGPSAEDWLSDDEVNQADSQKIFNDIMNELLPLSPEEIRRFKGKVDKRNKALTNSPPNSLGNRSLTINVTPGVTSPKVTVSPGLLTALVFTNSKGESWPVTSVVTGDNQLINSEIHKDSKHQILVSPLARNGHSNLLVGLKNLDQPIMIRLYINSGVDPSQNVDGLVNFRINSPEPPAEPSFGSVPSAEMELLLDLCDGLRPNDGVYLTTKPELPESYVYQERPGGPLFVRTPWDLVWPAWSAKAGSLSGQVVYRIEPVKQIIIEKDERSFTVDLPEARLTKED
jgi:intracellular multiplication protein IcmK